MSGFGKGDGIVDFRRNRGFKARQIVRMQSARVMHPRFEKGDRVALLPFLDLGFGAVELGVVHRVGAEAIGAILEEIGLAGLPHEARRAPGRNLDRDHVHAVDGLGADGIALCMPDKIDLRLGALDRRAHGITIVLADEHHGELPQAPQG